MIVIPENAEGVTPITPIASNLYLRDCSTITAAVKAASGAFVLIREV
jgi:hypothetical protein